MRPEVVSNISFGYHTYLKDCWMAGKLPTVKKGLYGLPLTKKNCSNEHIKPASLGGTLDLTNIALANKHVNNLRGNQPIGLFLTKAKLLDYLVQFIDVVVEFKGKIFKGNDYIQGILSSTKDLDIPG